MATINENDLDKFKETFAKIDNLFAGKSDFEKVKEWLKIKNEYSEYYPQHLCGLLDIPAEIRERYFQDIIDNKEFILFTLEHNANVYFEALKRNFIIDETSNSKANISDIEGKLKEIIDFEEVAFDLAKTQKIRFRQDFYENKYRHELAFLRIEDSFYEKLSYSDVSGFNSNYVVAYAKHRIYKPYLETILKVVYDAPQLEIKKNPKIYALIHAIKIMTGQTNNFDKTDNGNFVKREIVKCGVEEYGFTDGQMFYRKFTEIDLTNKPRLLSEFGKKEAEIRNSCNNDSQVISKYLELIS